MTKALQPSLRPHDVVVALYLLTLDGDWTYANAALALRLSASEVHASVGRLERSQLLRGSTRSVFVLPLLELLEHGLRFVFPPVTAASAARGVATATGAGSFVWAHARGREAGAALVPLYPTLPEAALASPRLHDVTALADTLRVGDAKARGTAREALEQRLRRRVWSA